jgi:hypothetical protein
MHDHRNAPRRHLSEHYLRISIKLCPIPILKRMKHDSARFVMGDANGYRRGVPPVIRPTDEPGEYTFHSKQITAAAPTSG